MIVAGESVGLKKKGWLVSVEEKRGQTVVESNAGVYFITIMMRYDEGSSDIAWELYSALDIQIGLPQHHHFAAQIPGIDHSTPAVQAHHFALICCLLVFGHFLSTGTVVLLDTPISTPDHQGTCLHIFVQGSGRGEQGNIMRNCVCLCLYTEYEQLFVHCRYRISVSL